MKYLITGSPGWLGSEFVKALSGHKNNLIHLAKNLNIEEIRCLKNESIAYERSKYRLCK